MQILQIILRLLVRTIKSAKDVSHTVCGLRPPQQQL